MNECEELLEQYRNKLRKLYDTVEEFTYDDELMNMHATKIERLMYIIIYEDED